MTKKISELPAASQANDADQMEANQAGTSRRVTRAQVIAGLATTANPVFTGTVTIPDGALAIADTNGLQAALDAKAPTANPVFTGTVTIPDGALAIADTSGLQTALNAKLATTALNVDQYDVLGRIASGNGAASGLTSGDITTEGAPASGDFVLGWESGGALRKFDIGALPGGGGTDDQTAAEVPFTPAGEISATDVQTALEELDTEKVDTAGAEAAAGSYIDGLSGVHDATTVLLGNNTFGAPPGSSGGGGLTTELNANTAITVGSGTDGEHHVLTSDSAITLTLDAQATVGMESAFTKAGSGAVSVAMESGAGYWVPSDDIGGTAATAGFTITGYGYFICIRNTGGNAAQWLFVGQSTLAASINGKLELGTGGSISDSGPISATGALTKALHGGRVVLTTGNVTIPNAAGDVGMGGVIKADASRTVTFNSTSLTLATGDLLTYYVQSTTVLIRSKRLAADQPAMA